MNNYPPIKALKNWISTSTPAFRAMLCDLSKTSDNMLTQWMSGRRAMSAEKAGLVANASKEIKKQFIEAPVALTRGDLCEACKKCEYFLADKK